MEGIGQPASPKTGKAIAGASYARLPKPAKLNPLPKPTPHTLRAQARFRVEGRAPPLPSTAMSFTTKKLLDEMKQQTAIERLGQMNFLQAATKKRIDRARQVKFRLLNPFFCKALKHFSM